MTKKINETHELKFITYFPYKNSKLKTKNGLVLLGIGSNIGNSQRTFKKLFGYLQKHPKIKIVQTSPIYKNPPFGYLEQNYFYNGVIKLKTTMRQSEFMHFLLHTERIFGRKRAFKNAPRTLDLDIIFFEKLFVYNKKIMIPHPKWQERDSVIVPMIYLYGRYKTI
jgi:2-amino-4-hydroxy-6-hydroxymethyldihydropteridine diphosphokinase